MARASERRLASIEARLRPLPPGEAELDDLPKHMPAVAPHGAPAPGVYERYGKPFAPARANQRYCSKLCRDRAASAQRRAGASCATVAEDLEPLRDLIARPFRSPPVPVASPDRSCLKLPALPWEAGPR